MAAPSMQTTTVIANVVDIATDLDQMIVVVDHDGMGEDGGSGRCRQAASSYTAAGTVDSSDERRWVRRRRAMAVANSGDRARVRRCNSRDR
ncbi:hypothetical protein ACLOJK_027726 [Asimina triloba]